MTETTANLNQTTAATPQQAKIIALVTPLIAPLGYEVVQAEVHTHRQKTLRLFIDHAGSTATEGTIGIEDCVKVTRALEEPLDSLTEIEAIFRGAYELEVSSPGADRPLRTEKDFTRFQGRRIRVHTFRPLTAAELGNDAHLQKNPKQKNFLGVLKGLAADGRVQLALQADAQEQKKSKAKPKGKKAKDLSPAGNDGETTNSVEEVVMIPLPLISKANLEPVFEFDE